MRYRELFYTGILAVAVSCSPFGLTEQQIDHVVLRVAAQPDSDARTVLPDYFDSFDSAVVELHADEKDPIVFANLDLDKPIELGELPAGTYDIYLHVYNSLGQHIMEGEAVDETLETGVVNDVTIELRLLESMPGSGSIQIGWDIAFPLASHYPTEMAYEFVRVPDTVGNPEDPEQEFVFSEVVDLDSPLGIEFEGDFWFEQADTEGTSHEMNGYRLLTEAENLDSGNYLLMLWFGSSPQWTTITQPIAVWSELISVAGGMITAADFTIDEQLLYPLPSEISSVGHYAVDEVDNEVLYTVIVGGSSNADHYRIEQEIGGEWQPVFDETETLSNNRFQLSAPIEQTTAFRIRPENFVGIGSWYEFSVTGESPVVTTDAGITIDVDNPQDLEGYFDGLGTSLYYLENNLITTELAADSYEWYIDVELVSTVQSFSLTDVAFSIPPGQSFNLTLVVEVEGEEYSGSTSMEMKSGFEEAEIWPAQGTHLLFQDLEMPMIMTLNPVPGAELYRVKGEWYSEFDSGVFDSGFRGAEDLDLSDPEIPAGVVPADAEVEFMVYAAREMDVEEIVTTTSGVYSFSTELEEGE